MRTNIKNNSNKQKRSTKARQNQLDDLETITAEMDAICRRRLRDGAIKDGPLAGMESAVRQEALIKVTGGFLHKNHDYIQARKSGNEDAIRAAMEKCAAIAMKYSKAQIRDELTHHESHHTELTDSNGGACMHPSLHKQFDWSTDAKASMVMTCVNRAVRDGSLSAANAGVVKMVCVQGLREVEIARLLRISPPAVSQRLRLVKKVLPKVMERVEVPWNF